MIEEALPGLRLFNRGKVRDIYDLGDNLLLVATDRISAFDVMLPTLIPGKGKILTALSEFWFGIVKDITPNHLDYDLCRRVPRRVPSISSDIGGPIDAGQKEHAGSGRMYRAWLPGRIRLERLPEYRQRVRYPAS